MRGWPVWIAAALGGSLLLGCERNTVQPSYPPDPLFVHKRPIEGKPDTAAPVVVHREPMAPAVPQTALASAPWQRQTSLKVDVTQASHQQPAVTPTTPPAGQGPALTPPTAPASGTSVPVIHTKAPTEAPSPPTGLQPVPGRYGHAPDYRWLQGVLDQHYHGHLDLRFCDASVEDDWGGKVCLEPDPRLASFKEGDVVLVEGEMVPENGETRRGSWNHYPHYRIHSIQLVQHRE